ncbi:unnamed protein product [Trichobilharzia regenti]|nr:unnamed protein product [Trichobilharzia regenti]
MNSNFYTFLSLFTDAFPPDLSILFTVRLESNLENELFTLFDRHGRLILRLTFGTHIQLEYLSKELQSEQLLTTHPRDFKTHSGKTLEKAIFKTRLNDGLYVN